MSNAVPRKPTFRRAVGLDYKSGSGFAPAISSKGEQLLADEMVRLAHRYGVPVVEDPELARALDAIEIDEQIPEVLFEAVALVLAEIEKGLRQRPQ